MKRRDFLTISAASFVTPGAHAQPRPPIVGFINDSGSNSGPAMIAFLRGLSRAGFIANQDVLLVYQQADTYAEAPALAQNLVNRSVAAIVALNTPNMAIAARDATKTIPVIFALAGDPVRLGLVESLEKPGGNLTGVMFTTPGVIDKWAEILHALAPASAPVGLLTNPTNSASQLARADLDGASARTGRKLITLEANSDAEIDAAFAKAAQEKIGSIAIDNDSRLARMRTKIIAAAARHKIATLYPDRDGAASGGLLSYGDQRAEQLRLLGEYVGRVLKGEKPAAMAIAQPARFELLLNLKTAAAQGLTIAPAIRAVATETIE